jgi:phosphatidylserine decarboxylase
MYPIHKEGKAFMIPAVLLLGIGVFSAYTAITGGLWLLLPIALLLVALGLLTINFFRNPPRPVAENLAENLVLCPCDGKVVVIEETLEPEVLNQKCIQVSIFMSPLNVHVNRHPLNATIGFYKYHEGKYLMAFNPKSSTENERTTTVYQWNDKLVLMRQVAGFLARRIICYAKANAKAVRGEDMGFIRFGSRVDLYLPLGTKILVTPGQVVKGNVDLIAEL